MSLATPPTVRKLQTTLHAKAKDAPTLRFSTLYDKVYRPDVLTHAYQLCRSNGGAPRVDGQTFDDIKSYGTTRWVDALTVSLREHTYRPGAVRRVMIPKPGQPCRYRPLGIPTMTDRVVETAALVVLESVFEADLQPEQICLPPQAQCVGRGQAGPFLGESGLYRGHRSGSQWVLREYSASRAYEIGGASCERPSHCSTSSTGGCMHR